jgi:glycosyltransferase involved in cell wall biosynthesis
MRVVQLGKYYYPHKGGIETHLRLLCQSLKGAVDIEAIVFNTGRRTERNSEEGVPITRCGNLITVASSPVSPSMVWELSKRKYDVLHLHVPNPLAAAAYLASRKPKHALVVSHHSDIIRQARLLRLVSPIMRRVLARADSILVASPNYLASSAELEGFRSKCRVVPYGLNLQEWAPNADTLRKAAHIRAQYPGPIVLSVGRLVYYKGFDVVIEATQGAASTLLIVGDGPLRGDLEAKVRAHGLDGKVVLVGEVEGSLLPYYLAADVFVLASVARSEAFGIVQLEAMACGLPVVNTALDSGVPFVSRHEDSGLTVPPGDARELAAAIGRLLGDSKLRKQYGERGRARVEAEFSVRSMSAAILRTYREVSEVRRTTALNDSLRARTP